MPSYIIATDMSMDPNTGVATGACVWKSLCSDSSGIILFWLGKLRNKICSWAELEIVARVLERIPPYSDVEFYVDQESLTHNLNERKSRDRLKDWKVYEFHSRILKIIDLIRSKNCSVRFVRNIKNPLYLRSHDLAVLHRKKFCPQNVLAQKRVKIERAPEKKAEKKPAKPKKDPNPPIRSAVLARNKRKWG